MVDPELDELDAAELPLFEPDDPEEPASDEFDELESVEPESDDDPDDPEAVDDEPRLSVLKNPLPLNVTPTGWNTFFTAMRDPDSGCSYSVSVSSVNACCTSIVSPVSTNL